MEKQIRFESEGRYYTEGDRENAAEVWFVLHGYGQLAKYFIRKFIPLTERSIYVIAPEALSYFYLEDTARRINSGNTRVGASWMTRENRLTDIRNYIAFLNSVYNDEIKDSKMKVTVLGFSQGAATASRWVLDGHVNFERLILWAGILPPDIDFSNGKKLLHNKETVVVYGTQDPFIDDAGFSKMNLLSEKLSINPKIIQFEGGHDIDTTTLLKLA